MQALKQLRMWYITEGTYRGRIWAEQPDGTVYDCGDMAFPHRCPSGYVMCVSRLVQTGPEMRARACRGLDERRKAEGTGDHGKQAEAKETPR